MLEVLFLLTKVSFSLQVPPPSLSFSETLSLQEPGSFDLRSFPSADFDCVFMMMFNMSLFFRISYKLPGGSRSLIRTSLAT